MTDAERIELAIRNVIDERKGDVDAPVMRALTLLADQLQYRNTYHAEDDKKLLEDLRRQQ